MSYIVLRQLIQDSAEIEKFLNDQCKAFQHALFYGISTLPVPEKFAGLINKEELRRQYENCNKQINNNKKNQKDAET